jgi:hypothetical protein
MDNIRNLILAEIKEISEEYQYHGFWKCGAAYVNGIDREDNPYLYFPSKEYCYNALMKEYNNFTDDDFTAKLVDVCISFNDGDKLNIPFELFKQKPEIRIDVEYNRDGPYGVLYIDYKAEETEHQIYQRLFGEIFIRATKKYILEKFI